MSDRREEVKCRRCGQWHSGIALDDIPTNYCEDCWAAAGVRATGSAGARRKERLSKPAAETPSEPPNDDYGPQTRALQEAKLQCIRDGRTFDIADALEALQGFLAAQLREGPSDSNHCPACNQNVSSEITEIRTGHWGGRPAVMFMDTFMRCAYCGEEFFSRAQADRHTIALLKATLAAQSAAPAGTPRAVTDEEVLEAIMEFGATANDGAAMRSVLESFLASRSVEATGGEDAPVTDTEVDVGCTLVYGSPTMASKGQRSTVKAALTRFSEDRAIARRSPPPESAE